MAAAAAAEVCVRERERGQESERERRGWKEGGRRGLGVIEEELKKPSTIMHRRRVRCKMSNNEKKKKNYRCWCAVSVALPGDLSLHNDYAWNSCAWCARRLSLLWLAMCALCSSNAILRAKEIACANAGFALESFFFFSFFVLHTGKSWNDKSTTNTHTRAPRHIAS